MQLRSCSLITVSALITCVILTAFYKMTIGPRSQIINNMQHLSFGWLSHFDYSQQPVNITNFWVNEISVKLTPGETVTCDNILPTSSSSMFSVKYLAERKAFDAHFKQVHKLSNMEGYSAQLKSQNWFYHIIAKREHVHTVCETGFNAGHSALMWLTSSQISRVFSFDLGSNVYSRPMAEYLTARFPGRLQVTFGDSTQTLPVFRQKIKSYVPNFKCDIIVVDGGHTYAVANADMENFQPLAKVNNSILVLDDYPSTLFTYDTLGKVWEERRKNGIIGEIFRCTTGQRGFIAGYFSK